MSYDNIPEMLKTQKQWVVWGIPGEPPKSPFQPSALLSLAAIPAKSGVPATWGTYDDAAKCVSLGIARGIGYEFADTGVCGIDLDHVLSDSGVISPEAKEIVEGLNSYTEISPSGNGLHIFITADGVNISRHRKQGGFVEIYGNARYFTVTGNVYDGYDRIACRPAELQRIHDRYLLPGRTKSAAVSYSAESSMNTDDSLRRGLEKDIVLRACWSGEWRGGDESASDQALMNKLAYWCNADYAAMCAAFLQSPYFAQKDEAHKKKCQRSDYLPNTAKAACAALRSTAERDAVRYRRERQNERER